MESLIPSVFDDFSSENLNYRSLSFKQIIKKNSVSMFTPKINMYNPKYGKSDEKTSILSKKTKSIQKNKKSIDRANQNDQKEKKWEILNEAFDLIRKGKYIVTKELKEYLIEIENWLKKLNCDDYKIILDKKEITVDTKIDEIIMIDIFLEEIKHLFFKLKKMRQTALINYLVLNPFIDLLSERFSRASVLRKRFSSLFGSSDTGKELLIILKIDYFQKCINDSQFHPDSLTKIMSLSYTNLHIIDLSKFFLPLNDNGHLLSYSNLLQKG